MAILTTIAGVPLFTTVQEALNWAAGNNCTGYHTHNHQGQQGFMGCTNHLQASGPPLNSTALTPSPQRSARTNNINSSTGGGGGY